MEGFEFERRAALLGALAPLLLTAAARAGQVNPAETSVTLPADIHYKPWGKLPPHSGEMAPLYGDSDKAGPDLVLMRWNPGYFSAPHTYATDRIQVVVSGVWHVDSGADFTPRQATPVPAGGFVLRHARTPHYDGVPSTARQPAVIAVFGEGPVDQTLLEPGQPAWRRV